MSWPSLKISTLLSTVKKEFSAPASPVQKSGSHILNGGTLQRFKERHPEDIESSQFKANGNDHSNLTIATS